MVGLVLIVGGRNSTGERSSAELFDPARARAGCSRPICWRRGRSHTARVTPGFLPVP